MLRQKIEKFDIEDIGSDNLQKESHWATLNDSGYQSAYEHFLVIHPFKK